MRHSVRGVKAFFRATPIRALTRLRLAACFSNIGNYSPGLREMLKQSRESKNDKVEDNYQIGNKEALLKFQGTLISAIQLAQSGDCHKAINDFFSAMTELPPRFDPHQQCHNEIVHLLEVLYTSEGFDADDFPILMDALYKSQFDSNKSYGASLLTLKFVHQNIDAILGITFEISNRRVAYYVLMMVTSLQEPFQSFFRQQLTIDENMLTEVRNKFVERALKDPLFASTDAVDQIKMIKACVDSRPKSVSSDAEEFKLIEGMIADLISKSKTQYDTLQLLIAAQSLPNISPELCKRLDEHYIALGKSAQHSLTVKMLPAKDLFYIVYLIESINSKFPLSANSLIQQIKWRMYTDKHKFSKLGRALLDYESPLINTIKLSEMKGFLLTPFEESDFVGKNTIILLNILLEEARRRQDSFYGNRFSLDVAAKIMEFFDKAPLSIIELNSLKNILGNINRLLPTQGYIDRIAELIVKMAEEGYLTTKLNLPQIKKIPVFLHSFINSFLEPTHPVLPKLLSVFYSNKQDSRRYFESKGMATYINVLAQFTALWMFKLHKYPDSLKHLPQSIQAQRVSSFHSNTSRLQEINQLLEQLVNEVFTEFKNLTNSKFQFEASELTTIIELCDVLVDLKVFPPESKEYKRSKKISSELLKVLKTSYDKPTEKTHKLHQPGDVVDWLTGHWITAKYHSMRGRFLDDFSQMLHDKGIKFYPKVVIGVYEASFYLPEYNLFLFTVGPSGISSEYDKLIPKYELREENLRWKGYNCHTLVAQYDANTLSPEIQLKLGLESCNRTELQ